MDARDTAALAELTRILAEAGLRPAGTYATNQGIVYAPPPVPREQQHEQPQHWSRQSQRIDPAHVTCAIEQEDIAENAQYCHCTNCRNNFNGNALRSYFRHLATTMSEKRCPTCRQPWSNWVLYTNSEAAAPAADPIPVDEPTAPADAPEDEVVWSNSHNANGDLVVTGVYANGRSVTIHSAL